MKTKLTIGQIVALVAALMVLLFFFFPWIELNLLLTSTTLSGFQIASGNGPVGSNFVGVPSLFLVPLSMTGVLVVAAICFSGQASKLKSIVALLLLGAGGISAHS